MKYYKIVLAILMGTAITALSACQSTQEESEETNMSEQAETDEEEAQTDDTAADITGEATDAKGLGYLKDVNVEDYVTLGEYIGLEIALDEPVVTDEDIDEYIEYVLQNYPAYLEVTDRAVQEGDTVDIDYVGKLDDVAFEGGTGNTSSLVIGSGGFIPGFEDGVIGMEIGETKDIDATFPDPYLYNPDLAGKTAVFTVTLNGIRVEQEAELTDEYVADFGIEGVTDVESYRAYLYDAMFSQLQSEYELQKNNMVLEAAFANTTFTGAPEEMVNRMNTVITSSVTSYAQMLGMSVADVVAASYGGTAEEYETTLYQQAETTVKEYVMLQAIADQEGISVSEQEVEDALAQEAADYGYSVVEEYKSVVDIEAYREYLMSQKVIQFLSDNAVVNGTE